jgi:hypothetical protein
MGKSLQLLKTLEMRVRIRQRSFLPPTPVVVLAEVYLVA